jgi:hypothetical protein
MVAQRSVEPIGVLAEILWPSVFKRLKATPSCSKFITAEETEMPRSRGGSSETWETVTLSQLGVTILIPGVSSTQDQMPQVVSPDHEGHPWTPSVHSWTPNCRHGCCRNIRRGCDEVSEVAVSLQYSGRAPGRVGVGGSQTEASAWSAITER